MTDVDIAIIGAGLAGLTAARILAERGRSVVLIDRKTDLGKGVHTTGIFVRKTFEDFGFPDGCLGPALSTVHLSAPSGRTLTLESPAPEFRVALMPRLYRTLLQQAVAVGVTWRPGTRFLKREDLTDGSRLHLAAKTGDQTLTCRYLIGADGARSRTAASLDLHRNHRFLVGAETIYRQKMEEDAAPGLYCTIDPRLAPGYLAWTTVDGFHKHVGVAGLPGRFSPKQSLETYKGQMTNRFKLNPEDILEHRGGLIPVGGIGNRLANRRGLLIGDATGAVSPLTAGGLDPCLRLTQFACKIVDNYLSDGDPTILKAYRGKRFRRRFTKRLLLRRLMNYLTIPFLCEAAVILLKQPPFQAPAAEIFFRRGSFPDPTMPTRRELSMMF
ncbi:MAG: NAD(P)/FAD-dependent oxidoreductase [Acidobacteriota bacterium]|nr:NAD(P)/FAD-dependent oxidoreductase [Acidobacteriota bacterium]